MADFPASEIKKHLFICTNRPPMKEGDTMIPNRCGYKNAEKLRQDTKTLCQALGKSVRVNSAGCLGRCEEGIVAVAYPEGKWVTCLNENDAALLCEILK